MTFKNGVFLLLFSLCSVVENMNYKPLEVALASNSSHVKRFLEFVSSCVLKYNKQSLGKLVLSTHYRCYQVSVKEI